MQLPDSRCCTISISMTFTSYTERPSYVYHVAHEYYMPSRSQYSARKTSWLWRIENNGFATRSWLILPMYASEPSHITLQPPNKTCQRHDR